jgi:hypothetical protein
MKDQLPKYQAGWGATFCSFLLIISWFYPDPFVKFSREYPFLAAVGFLIITFLIFNEWKKMKILDRFKKKKHP